MHQIRAITLYSYPDVAAALGIDGNQLLARAGISRPSLDEPESRLPAEACIRLLEKAAELSGCDSFGIRMAQCRSFESLGGIALLLERLSTLGEVLSVISDLRRHVSDVLYVSLEQVEYSAIVTFDVIPPLGRIQAADLTVGLGHLTLTGATRGRWVPETVHFTRPVPNDRKTFERFFQAPLEFNSTFNGFSFSGDDLNMPLPLANAMMAHHAKRMLGLVNLPSLTSPVSDHARHSIALLLSSGNASLDKIAANLSKTPRGLQRDLQAEGNKFGQLLNEVKRDVAQKLLAGSGDSVSSISEALGYAALPAFTRWFEHEFGLPPTRWRTLRQSMDSRPPPGWKV